MRKEFSTEHRQVLKFSRLHILLPPYSLPGETPRPSAAGVGGDPTFKPMLLSMVPPGAKKKGGGGDKLDGEKERLEGGREVCMHPVPGREET